MLLATALVLALGSCGGDGGGAGSGGEDAPASAARPVPPSVAREAEEQGTVLVVVLLAVEYAPEAELGRDGVAAQRAEIAETQDAVLRSLGEHGRLAGRPERLPQLAVRVDAEGLEILAASPDVAAVEANEPEPPAPS